MRIPNEAGKLGNYDEECERLAKHLGAHTTVVIVVNGTKGSGFSVTTEDEKNMGVLPDLLEMVAKKIRADFARAEKQ